MGHTVYDALKRVLSSGIPQRVRRFPQGIFVATYSTVLSR